eukprot:CAMPEP_0177527606 /NCGR_PEP_ID=MMETSP0369-20130122/51741_1 /TAXON_ID=447022 ORGANISM="Scrippsiella hangoei-like, Strain SHHI-4" /NCGR_SAMPLE_ID=MMETSP0369 /ASSEMBLY_ACC=CAM_ASM_000364 /LENGTH=176 /DNA_ID=CAMNT_0019007977 /DNA_START=270 /DNA_END=800 /DNA_ORIENTATION=+
METPAGGGCGHLPRLATCLVDCTLRDMHTMYLALTTLEQRHFAPLRGLDPRETGPSTVAFFTHAALPASSKEMFKQSPHETPRVSQAGTGLREYKPTSRLNEFTKHETEPELRGPTRPFTQQPTMPQNHGDTCRNRLRAFPKACQIFVDCTLRNMRTIHLARTTLEQRHLARFRGH